MVKLGRFELPKRLLRDDQTATPTYAKFYAEPFEKGFGYTVGNSLRRVLLSSIEGVAVRSIKIDGVLHEFSTIPGVQEDVPEIILNVKNILFKSHTREPKKVEINVDKEGSVKASDIKLDHTLEIVNPDFHIAALTKKVKFRMEMELGVGRGYWPSERNKEGEQIIGLIPIDSIFTPVRKVKYFVEDTRVGQMTDFDRLVMEIWTDGRISPEDALRQSSAILRHHLDAFVNYDESYVQFEEEPSQEDKDRAQMDKVLSMSIDEVELSVRASNCIQKANIKTIGDLVQKSEPEMLKYKNFGKKSLNEIKKILTDMGLSLGMDISQLEGKGLIQPQKEEKIAL
ncbi:MAG: DNA-directed RNA polymerase subunit alpha [Chlamydiae bacterium]|nr:DNA-directed RNA polymerase subunit alpha [Chlamydiota bacterium]MBI3277000.1 DNA-directed RNA polymerase subunit alpha [Chlamydiota bacterium]